MRGAQVELVLVVERLERRDAAVDQGIVERGLWSDGEVGTDVFYPHAPDVASLPRVGGSPSVGDPQQRHRQCPDRFERDPYVAIENHRRPPEVSRLGVVDQHHEVFVARFGRVVRQIQGGIVHPRNGREVGEFGPRLQHLGFTAFG